MFKIMLTKISVNSFGHLDFENLRIVSDFDIQISDFCNLHSWDRLCVLSLRWPVQSVNGEITRQPRTRGLPLRSWGSVNIADTVDIIPCTARPNRMHSNWSSRADVRLWLLAHSKLDSCVSAAEPIRLNAAGMRASSECCCYSYLIRSLFLQASSSNG